MDTSKPTTKIEEATPTSTERQRILQYSVTLTTPKDWTDEQNQAAIKQLELSQVQMKVETLVRHEVFRISRNPRRSWARFISVTVDAD